MVIKTVLGLNTMRMVSSITKVTTRTVRRSLRNEKIYVFGSSRE